jgi:hypothetical protein
MAWAGSAASDGGVADDAQPAMARAGSAASDGGVADDAQRAMAWAGSAASDGGVARWGRQCTIYFSFRPTHMLKDDFAKHATTRDAMCVFGVGGGWGEGSLCSKTPFYETLDFLGAIVQHRKTAV